MPQMLAKDDPAPLLGPPRNALLWMRAKDMAQALGRGADFQTILQMYQMLSLAPGFGAVSKAGSIMDAAHRLNHSPQMSRLVDSMVRGIPQRARVAPPQKPQDALATLPLQPSQGVALGEALTQVLRDAPDPHTAAAETLRACAPYPQVDLPMRKELSRIMAFLHKTGAAAQKSCPSSEARRPYLTLKKAAGEGSRGGKVIGHTKSGKPIYATSSHSPQFTLRDHRDAARAHGKMVETLHGQAMDLRRKGTEHYPKALEIDKVADHHIEQRRAHLSLGGDFWEKSTTMDSRSHVMPQTLIHLTLSKAGGEGSRGGKVIGHTKSGKPVYEAAGHKGHANFTAADHRDAARLHDKRGEDPKFADILDLPSQADHHRDMAEAESHKVGKTASGKTVAGPWTNRYSGLEKVSAGARGKHVAAAHMKFHAKHKAELWTGQSRTGLTEIKRVADGHTQAAARLKRMGKSQIPFHGEETSMKKADELAGITVGANAIEPDNSRAPQELDDLQALQSIISDFEAANVGGTQGVRIIDWATKDSTETGVDGVTAQTLDVDKQGNAPVLPFGDSITVEKSLSPGVSMPLLSTIDFFARQARQRMGL